MKLKEVNFAIFFIISIISKEQKYLIFSFCNFLLVFSKRFANCSSHSIHNKNEEGRRFEISEERPYPKTGEAKIKKVFSNEAIEEIKASILELGAFFEYKKRPLYWTVCSPASVSTTWGTLESTYVSTKVLKVTVHLFQKAWCEYQLILDFSI